MVYQHITSNKIKTALLITLFLVIVIALGFVFSQAYGNSNILYAAVGFSFLMSFLSYFYSDKLVLSMSKAREIKRTEDPELYRTVENLSIAAGLPTPKIYLIDDTALWKI